MRRTLRRNLVQVRDGDNLVVIRHLPHHVPHFYGNFTRHPRVDLVEHDGRQPPLVGQNVLDDHHQPREFTARRHVAQFLRLDAFIGTKKKGNKVDAVGRGRHFRHFERERSIGHSQLDQALTNVFLDAFADCLAGGG